MVVEDLNPVLRGWGNYFRYGNSHGSSTPSTATSMTDGQPGQQQTRAPRSELGHPLHLRVAHRSRHLSPHWNGALLRDCVCLTVNDVGEPDEWRTSCPESIGGGWQSQPPWRGRTRTYGKPYGLSLPDLTRMAEPAAYLTVVLSRWPPSRTPGGEERQIRDKVGGLDIHRDRRCRLREGDGA